MKKSIAILLIILLFAGCSRKPDPEVVEFENTVNQLSNLTIDSGEALLLAKEKLENIYERKLIKADRYEEYADQLKDLDFAYYWIYRMQPFLEQYGLSGVSFEFAKRYYHMNTWDREVVFSCKQFEDLSDDEKLMFLYDTNPSFDTKEGEEYHQHSTLLFTGDGETAYRRTGTWPGNELVLQKWIINGKDLEYKETAYSKQGQKSSSTSTRKKCERCNGSGYIKYYYGSSSLEAWLAGEPDYQLSKCYVCHGTGYAD